MKMFLILNNDNDTYCAEWSHFNCSDAHACWKSLREIEGDNDYRNDNTKLKKFSTEQEAIDYIEDNNLVDDVNDIELVQTNPIINFWHRLCDAFQRQKQNDDDNIHLI